MPNLNANHDPVQTTAEASRQFSFWVGYGYPQKGKGGMLDAAYFKRGTEILYNLATTHFDRQKPGFFARLFRTKAAREYAAERREMERMVADLRRLDPNGKWGMSTMEKVDYRKFLDRNYVRHELSDWESPYMKNDRHPIEPEYEQWFVEMDTGFDNITREFSDEPEREVDADLVDEFETLNKISEAEQKEPYEPVSETEKSRESEKSLDESASEKSSDGIRILGEDD